MDNGLIQIKDLKFRTFISAEQIQEAVREVAAAVSQDMAGQNPLFVVMLNGAFMFAADLLKHVNVPAEVTFVKMSSYEGTHTTGEVRQTMPLTQSVEDRTVVIIEDIVDTGFTMQHTLRMMKEMGAKSVSICTFFRKPDAIRVPDLRVDYVAMDIPNAFVVGYGLDYDGYGRNLEEVYVLAD